MQLVARRPTGVEDSEPDATGMVFYRARYYHPGLGRFASRDPMGMADSVSPYAYVANNPINLVDPFGMEAALAGTTMNPAYWGMAAANDAGTTSDVVKSWMSLVPGANAVNNATANFKAGNYGSAALWGIGALADAALAVGTGGESTAVKTAIGGAVKGIGATGKVGENALRTLGGESQVYFKTSQGGRYVDQLVNGVAHESKVGYTSLTSTIRGQIAKDAELIQTGRINGATWNFFTSPVTGKGGASQPLLDALRQNGIDYIIH